MSKDFNVYKWRREHLTENFYFNRELQNGQWDDEPGVKVKRMYDPITKSSSEKEYDGSFTIKTKGDFFLDDESFATFGEYVLPIIKSKGYTFVGNSAAEGSSLSMRHYFYYLKPNPLK